jgi:hypothetical protein
MEVGGGDFYSAKSGDGGMVEKVEVDVNGLQAPRVIQSNSNMNVLMFIVII